MKKLILFALLSFTGLFLYGEQTNFEEFAERVYAEYPWLAEAGFVSEHAYDEFDGDPERFINYLKMNPFCYDCVEDEDIDIETLLKEGN